MVSTAGIAPAVALARDGLEDRCLVYPSPVEGKWSPYLESHKGIDLRRVALYLSEL